jgi:DNA repair protein RadC
MQLELSKKQNTRAITKNSSVKEDTPMYKLEQVGCQVLTDNELISVILNVPLEAAQEFMRSISYDIKTLGELDRNELIMPGITSRKVNTLMAALELGRRRSKRTGKDKVFIKSARDIYEVLKSYYIDIHIEIFVVAYLNRANAIIAIETISMGGMTGTVADPRVILRKAIVHRACGLVLSHNHPSGNLNPSKADGDLTVKIKAGAALLDITVLDHVILTADSYYSFADNGNI